MRMGERFAVTVLTGLTGGVFALVLADMTLISIDAPERYSALRFVVTRPILIAMLAFKDGFRDREQGDERQLPPPRTAPPEWLGETTRLRPNAGAVGHECWPGNSARRPASADGSVAWPPSRSIAFVAACGNSTATGTPGVASPAASASASGAGSSGSPSSGRLLDGRHAIRRRPRGGAARPDDPGREDRPDDPGREERHRCAERRRRSTSARSSAAAADSPIPTPRRPGTTWSTRTSRPPSGPAWASRSSTASTPCTGTTTSRARRSSRRTSAWAPRTTPRSSQQVCSATALEMNATGIRWDFGPVVAVPQDIRWGRTFEGYGETTDLVSEARRGLHQGPAGLRPERRRHRGGDGEALHRRRRDGLRHLHGERPDRPVPARPGRRPDGRGHAAQALPAAVPGGHRQRRPDRHGLLLEHDRRQGPRRPPPDHRHPQGPAGLHRLRRLRLGRRRPGGAGRLLGVPRAGDQRRHRHGHGPDRLRPVHHDHEVAGAGRDDQGRTGSTTPSRGSCG